MWQCFKHGFLMGLSYLFNSYSFPHPSHTSDLPLCKSVCDWPDGSDFRHNGVLMSFVKIGSWAEERETQVSASAEGNAGRFGLRVSWLTSVARPTSASMVLGLPQCWHILSSPLRRRSLDNKFLGNQVLLLPLFLEQLVNLAVADGGWSSILSFRWCLVHLAYASLLDPKGICR